MPDDFSAMLQRARTGSLSSREYSDLTSNRCMDQLRPLVTESDLAWILPKLLSHADERCAFQISLTRNFALRADVREVLHSSWGAASQFQKTHLLWRILDDPELPLEWHERLFGFVEENWGAFQETCLKFYGEESDTAIASMIERYHSPDFPASKKWAYLCNLAAAEGCTPRVRIFLEQATRSDQPFERKVAASLISRISG